MAFLFFYLLGTKNTMLIYLAFGIAYMLLSAVGPIGSFVPEQFKDNVRYSGVSISVQMAAVLGGGIGPMVATILNATYGIWSISVYIFIIAIISVGAVLALPESSKYRSPKVEASGSGSSRSQPIFKS
jgi:MFS transporter, MHS family, shikimate and dehydroshikimate transport protein